uniref:Uncharacterized protein n=1 Tax=Brugia malayi TaxID=6279 RepID=A8PV42_BRUMA
MCQMQLNTLRNTQLTIYSSIDQKTRTSDSCGTDKMKVTWRGLPCSSSNPGVANSVGEHKHRGKGTGSIPPTPYHFSGNGAAANDICIQMTAG